MRAPPASFKSELTAYRRKLFLHRANHPQLRLCLEVLNRWENHGSVETRWNTITEKLPPEARPTAGQFIDLVLERRVVAEELYRVMREAPGEKAKKRARIKRRLNTDAEWQAGAKIFTALADFRDKSEQVLGREKGTAPRKRFESGWRDKFKEQCGQPLDEVVRVLSEIAFGGERKIGAVRGTQRHRDTRPPK